MMRFLSTSTPFKEAGLEPVAIMIFGAFSVTAAFPSLLTSTVVLFTKVPCP
ncbi:MAG: hypothetical protein BWY67_01839 [Bacteroidetes bacterium ADurb.Bin397]|nr:MAG: hypothetical protein BWY67_01839 [Bacteroidetes bacterium ADurb.Bin397]